MSMSSFRFKVSGIFVVLFVSFGVDHRLLILLVFADQIVHIRFRFGEFLRGENEPIVEERTKTHDLIHSFARVPMEKRFSTEHRRELFGNAFPQIDHRRGVR